MKIPKIAFLIFALSLSTLFDGTAFSSDKEKELRSIGSMDLKELTSRARAALDKKYPGENWGRYKFPRFVYIH
jgi:hypothetical protein